MRLSVPPLTTPLWTLGWTAMVTLEHGSSSHGTIPFASFDAELLPLSAVSAGCHGCLESEIFSSTEGESFRKGTVCCFSMIPAPQNNTRTADWPQREIRDMLLGAPILLSSSEQRRRRIHCLRIRGIPPWRSKQCTKQR